MTVPRTSDASARSGFEEREEPRMKCDSLRDAIVELARGGDAGPGTLAAVESHLDHCASCAALMTRERQLSQGLRALAARDRGRCALGRSRTASAGVVCRAASHRAAGGAGGGRAAGCLARPQSALVAGALRRVVGHAASQPAADDTTTVAEAHAAQKPDRASAGCTTPVGALGGWRARDARPATAWRAATYRARRPRRARDRLRVDSRGGRAAGFRERRDHPDGDPARRRCRPTGIEILPDAQGAPVEADLLVGQDGQARAIGW